MSADLAKVVHTSEPLDPTHEAVSSELYRQAAHWAALALSPGLSAEEASSVQSPDWSQIERGMFTPPAEGVSSAEASRELVSSKGFDYFAELSLDDQRRARVSLQALAQGLLDELDAPQTAVETLRTQRTLRIALVPLCVLAAILAGWWSNESRLARSELTAGKSWQTSSNYGLGGCNSPEQLCEGNKGYFFHTRSDDKNPWVEFDLAADVQVSKVTVENREDCCEERAVPLVIEVSQDRAAWQEVARSVAKFSTWRATFAPVHARYVRLRIPRPTALHLHRVRMYP